MFMEVSQLLGHPPFIFAPDFKLTIIANLIKGVKT